MKTMRNKRSDEHSAAALVTHCFDAVFDALAAARYEMWEVNNHHRETIEFFNCCQAKSKELFVLFNFFSKVHLEIALKIKSMSSPTQRRTPSKVYAKHPGFF